MHVARQVWPSRSPSLFIDQKCRRSLRWRVFECKISRSLHMPCRLLACLLSSLCARGATGNGPTDQCWRRQAEARRRLCVLSAWCLCASEEKRTRVAGIYSCITLLGIASPPGSWRLGGLPEMRRSSNSRGRSMHCNIVHDIYNFNGATVCAAKRHTRSPLHRGFPP